MPTKEQMETTIAEIERTLADYPMQRTMQFLQMQDHEWPGFARDEQLMVIGRVFGFESKDQWMSGLDGEMSLEEIKATPGWKRSIDLDEYLDGAPEREIDQWYDWMESQDADNQTAEGYEAHIPEPQTTVRPLTNDLINAVILDVWPKVPAVVDFGIDSDRHLGALQFAIKYGEVTPLELDAAMGDGAKLTEIVQRGGNPYRDVIFRTSWDEMRLEPPDETMAPDEPAPLADCPDHHGLTERILFGKILHSGPSPAPQPEKSAPAKSRDDGGIEI